MKFVINENKRGLFCDHEFGMQTSAKEQSVGRGGANHFFHS